MAEEDKSVRGMVKDIDQRTKDLTPVLEKLTDSLKKIGDSFGGEKMSKKFTAESRESLLNKFAPPIMKGGKSVDFGSSIKDLGEQLSKNHKESFEIFKSIDSTLKKIQEKGGSLGGGGIDIDLPSGGKSGKGKAAARAAAGAGRFLSRAVPLAAAGIVGIDAYQGYANAAENLGIEDREATLGEKMASTMGAVTESLSFGRLSGKDIGKVLAGTEEGKKIAEKNRAEVSGMSSEFGDVFAPSPEINVQAAPPTTLQAPAQEVKVQAAPPTTVQAPAPEVTVQPAVSTTAPNKPASATVTPTAPQEKITGYMSLADRRARKAASESAAPPAAVAVTAAPETAPSTDPALSKFKFNDKDGPDSEEGKIRTKVRQVMRGEDIKLSPLEEKYMKEWERRNSAQGEAVYNQAPATSSEPSAVTPVPTSTETASVTPAPTSTEPTTTVTPKETVTGEPAKTGYMTLAERRAAREAAGGPKPIKKDPETEKMEGRIRQFLRGEDVTLTPAEEKHMKEMETNINARSEAYNQASGVSPKMNQGTTTTSTTVSTVSAENADMRAEGTGAIQPVVINNTNSMSTNTASIAPIRTLPRPSNNSFERKQNAVASF